jgi:hypothetical protein
MFMAFIYHPDTDCDNDCDNDCDTDCDTDCLRKDLANALLPSNGSNTKYVNIHTETEAMPG